MRSSVCTGGRKGCSTQRPPAAVFLTQKLRGRSVTQGPLKLSSKEPRCYGIHITALLPQCVPFPRHNTYMSLAFEQLHRLLWVSSTECKGTESVGRFVFKPSQQLVQA